MKTNSVGSKFELVSKYKPAGDQQKAIDTLYKNLNSKKYQTLLGATGTGKTFTIANIINKMQKKTLVLAHNKTLAAQLYQEFKNFFPNNKVEYFVSYFDYYQPEAYLPSSDTYIEKTSQLNNEIEMMRLSTINSLSTEDKVIVVASVACIYASASPSDFDRYTYLLKVNDKLTLSEFRKQMIKLEYSYNDVNLKPGTFRVKGDVIDIAMGYTDKYILRISIFGDVIEKITKTDPLTQQVITKINYFLLTPASEYIMNKDDFEVQLNNIAIEMKDREQFYLNENRLLEAQRIVQRTKYDLEAMREFGFCNGIENYSRHLENRLEGETPYTIFDFFNKDDDWLMVVDESHMSLPQIRGMYNTDRSRKETLVEYGFRLPSALDNRPLNFEEFNNRLKHAIFVSATPNDYEIKLSNNEVVEQIVRPTYLLDPIVEIRSKKNQIDDLINELTKQAATKQKTFITVMTIRMAEELTEYLKQRNIKVAYLHNELKTLQRTKIISDLRNDTYDVVVGINLLREGIDVPEVSLVCIFDADKPGFFRSYKSLIQTIGRAARNTNGKVIMYADEISKDMQLAIDETNRRRKIQQAYNIEHNCVPTTIIKSKDDTFFNLENIDHLSANKPISIQALKKQMLKAAQEQNYELAAVLRDQIIEYSAHKVAPKNNKK